MIIIIILAVLHRTQDLSSWTRDPTLAACSRTTELYGVLTREVFIIYIIIGTT